MNVAATLHLSRLVPDPRSRSARLLLAQPAKLYAALIEAFPESLRHHSGPDSSAPRGLLYRIETATRECPQTILIQSTEEPDWSRLPANASGLARESAPPEVRTIAPAFTPGAMMQFRLRANPTTAKARHDLRANGKRHGGKHIPVLGEDAQRHWLLRKLAGAAEPVDFRTTDEGNPRIRGSAGAGARVVSVLYEGQLRVLDPVALLSLVERGIGRGRAFGFGLLSFRYPR